ncbi:MAG: aminotransferase class I/II-fold pyridoxal phosphate-dependent enzyme [Pseudonocardiaceae bacterium]
MLSRVRACSIARAVLDHNRRHPDNPAWVVADDVYAGSHLCTEVTPQPIAALAGADLGDDHLGVMSDHTVTITTPSKTVALPTSRVAFATTTRATMRAALAHYRTVFSFGRVPQTGELSGLAALCLTPQTWIDSWNAEYRRRLTVLNAALEAINQELRCEVYQAPRPEGGWYFALRVARHLFPADVVSAVHACAVLLHYGQGRRDSGVAMLPGELFGHGLGRPEQWLTLRGSLAVSCDDLQVCVERLREVALLLRGPHGPHAVRHALARARSIADLDQVLAQRRY